MKPAAAATGCSDWRQSVQTRWLSPGGNFRRVAVLSEGDAQARAFVSPSPKLPPMLMFLPRQLRRRATESPGAALARRVAGGDRLALEEVYRREAGPVYRYALALSGNPAWAADATQDAFIAFAQRAAGFDESLGTLGAYLAGAARHSLLAQWRRERVEQPGGETAEDATPWNASTPTTASPEQLLVRAQGSAALWAALHRLPMAMREALVLVDLQERPYAEAARIAGIELNTLRTRLHRARARLAALLDAPDGVRLEDLS
jgi:RNA polymerase sigma-70 factor, ECF subfamily